MTTTSEKLIVDSWDYYLDDDSPAREHVEMFREVEWVYMQKELRHDLDYELGVGQEPHWVEPGRAILYHNVSVSEYGRETNYGWKATNPLPIGNAIQLRNYLQKGFRLRASVEPQVNVESSETAEYTEGDLYENAPYVVPGKKAPRKFITWDAYRSYCDTRGISLRYDPPQEILDKMKEYEFYCLVHDHGFNSKRAAKNHRAYYVAPPPRGRGQKHATLEQMEVIQPKAKTSKTTKKTSSKATGEGLK
jgi:hypothetical protein|tara:strand:+ start:213 stop:956 length:744 start_codon:yes stop_codon:yes gene_type:complete